MGAWEVSARYSELALGQQVFTGGFADQNLWTNRARMVDLGFNCDLNKFVKVYFDWEHAMFGSPVFAFERCDLSVHPAQRILIANGINRAPPRVRRPFSSVE